MSSSENQGKIKKLGRPRKHVDDDQKMEFMREYQKKKQFEYREKKRQLKKQMSSNQIKLLTFLRSNVISANDAMELLEILNFNK